MEVYLWGLNTQHQIRNNNKKRIKIPQKISIPISINTVCFSKSIMMVLSNAGDVYQYRATNDIRKINQLSSITKLKCGDYHYTAISKRRQLYCWGIGDNGCLGMEPIEQQLIPFKVATDIVDVFCGPSSTFLLNESNQLFGCGDNTFGQLGVGSNNQDQEISRVNINGIVVDVASDSTHTMFLTSQKQIYVAGQNKQGCLGLESIGQKINIPIKIISKDKFISIACGGYSVAVSQKGSIFNWGYCPSGLINTPTIVDKISKKFVQVKSNNQNSYALSQDGQLWVWGSNKYGQLGVGDIEQRIKPFPVILLQDLDINNVFVGMTSVLCIGQKRQLNMQSTFKRKCCSKRKSNDSVNKSLRMSRNCTSSSKKRSINSRSCNSNNKSRCKQSKSKQLQLSNKVNIDQFLKSKQYLKQTIKQQLKQHLKQNNIINHKLLTNKLISNKCPIKVIDDYIDRQSFQGQFQGTYSSIPHYQSNISKRYQHKQYRTVLNKTNEIKDSQMEEIMNQNRQLKQLIQEKDLIIQDIIAKIQALEQAIEERDSKDQITLREHINKQVEKMENRYIGQISKLSGVIQGFANRYNTQTTNAYDTLVQKDRQLNKQKIIDGTPKCNGKQIVTQQQIDNQILYTNNLTLNPCSFQYKKSKPLLPSISYDLKNQQQQSLYKLQLQNKITQLQLKIQSMNQQFSYQLQNNIRQLDMYKYKIKQLNKIVSQKNQIIFQLQKQSNNVQLLDMNPNVLSYQSISNSKQNNNDSNSNSKSNNNNMKLRQITNRQNNHIGRVIENIQKNKRRISQSAEKLINILEST